LKSEFSDWESPDLIKELNEMINKAKQEERERIIKLIDVIYKQDFEESMCDETKTNIKNWLIELINNE